MNTTQGRRPSRRSQWDRWPPESFGPQWEKLWLGGSLRAFHIDFDNERDLSEFRLRAQVFRLQRKRMEAEGWKALYRCKSKVYPGEPLRLHFIPVEESYQKYFSQVGIGYTENESLPKPAAPPEAGDADPEDDFIEKLLEEQRLREEGGGLSPPKEPRHE